MADHHLPPWPLPLLLLLFLSLSAPRTAADDDCSILLQFKAQLPSGGGDDSALASWDVSQPCSDWLGVTYNATTGKVTKLRLEGKNLWGNLTLDKLAGLQGLRLLSFKNNDFTGPMPDLTQLPELKLVDLSGNRFSGEIPDGMFSVTRGLTKLWLSNNNFSGPIPTSLTAPKKLIELWLDGNKFEGPIPEFSQPSLTVVDVALNNLDGPIPARLSDMSASFFQGNKNLCGRPLAIACKSSKKKISPGIVAAIILIAVAVSLAVVGVIIFALRRQQRVTSANHLRLGKPIKTTEHFGAGGGGRAELRMLTSTDKAAAKEEEKGKLTFVAAAERRRKTFELQDLLRSSADVLGSGSFGSSYKAALLNGPTVVVKRFREMNAVGREEFQQHMARLGRLSHPNLLPLLAYYYRKENKLLVSDYIPNGSLAHMLHGNRRSNSPLDWPKRLNIIKGVARGLAYLYEELSMLQVPHGHLKSSNVLLDLAFEPVLTDYGLLPVVNRSLASEAMVVYKSPECGAHHGKPSKKSDVWSLGILILEMITGKFPANQLRRGRAAGTDLASWVNSVVREEWTGEVFDVTMKGTKNCEGEMLKLLRVGMACCEMDVGRRMEMEVAIGKIEELKEREVDEESSSINVSEGEGHSNKVMTDDDEFAFSK